MPWLDSLLAAALDAGHSSALVAPGLLVLIAAAHVIYFWLHFSRVCQQAILVEDLSIPGTARGKAGTIVEATAIEFDARHRTSCGAVLGVPRYFLPEIRSRLFHIHDSHRMDGGHLTRSGVFREDLEVLGRCTFHKPIKIGGDLVIHGDALFLAPVVVNGTLTVRGTAHFSAGVVAKDDALVSGMLKVGSDDATGWAVLRELLLADRLGLNGTLVADRAVQLKEAA